MSAPKQHGHSYLNRKPTPTYTAWRSMFNRCRSDQHYKNVQVCKRWRLFPNFIADMGERPVGATVDRIDNSMGYEPKNCRWATRKQQARNRSTNNLITFNGETKTLEEWADEVGIKSNTLWMRLYHSRWSLEKAMTTPVDRNGGRFGGA